MDPSVMSDAVAEVPFWWHSIELAPGLVTPGARPLETLEQEWDSLAVPALTGKSVLDIGAWDGWHSFRAERLGAARVVSADLHAWAIDHAEAPPGAHPLDAPATRLDRGELPGRRGYDVAHAALGSAAEPIVADVTELDPARIGDFDVVLFVGVLYHRIDVVEALRAVRAVTAGVAIIETAVMVIDAVEDIPLARVLPGAELNEDPTNWWQPNLAGIRALAHAAGFTRTEPVTCEPARILPSGPPVPYARAVIHAFP